MDENESKFWHPEIIGWSDDILPYYESIVPQLADNAIIVEVGIFHGRSALFMIEELAKNKPEVLFYGVDISPCPIALNDQKINFMHMTSTAAAATFADNSLDFVFIDGDHSYESAIEDIKVWFPKVKIGGIISGHDYNDYAYYTGINNDMVVGPHLGIIKAVHESFGDDFKLVTKTVWQHIKTK